MKETAFRRPPWKKQVDNSATHDWVLAEISDVDPDHQMCMWKCLRCGFSKLSVESTKPSLANASCDEWILYSVHKS